MPLPQQLLDTIIKYSRTRIFKILLFGLLGVSMFFGGLIILFIFPFVLNFILSLIIVLREDNLFTSIWSSPPISLPLRVYLFNLDNPEEFRKGAKPKVSERGPYVYLMSAEHEVIEWSSDGKTAKYYLKSNFEFDSDRTQADMNQKLTMLNLVKFTGGATVQNKIDSIPSSSPLKKVFALIKGYLMAQEEDVIQESTPKVLIEGKGMERTEELEFFIIKPMKWIGINIPRSDFFKEYFKDNKFSILRSAQNAKIGPIQINTGQLKHKHFTRILGLGHQSSLNDSTGRPLWNDTKCNRITGIQGFWFGTYMKRDYLINISNVYLGRTLTFSYKGMSLVKGSIQWRFWLSPDELASPDKNPGNRCYCTTPHDYELCDGIYDIGYTEFSAPVVISHPHLLHASDKLRSRVEGLNPDPDNHQTYLDVNPMLGLPVNGWIRMQVNLVVKPIPFLRGFGQLPEAIYPLFWIEVEVRPSSTLLDLLLTFNLMGLMGLEYWPYFSVVFGAIFLYITFNMICKKTNKSTLLETFDNSENEKDSKLNDNSYSNREVVVEAMPPNYESLEFDPSDNSDSYPGSDQVQTHTPSDFMSNRIKVEQRGVRLLPGVIE